jgi:photosynthetic reaction center M subunit
MKVESARTDNESYLEYHPNNHIGGRKGYFDQHIEFEGVPIFGELFRFFGQTQLGPIYIGIWGILALASGFMFSLIWGMGMMSTVGFDPVAFVKYFAVLQIDPPNSMNGLWGFPPLEQGGWWLAATFFLTLSILFWWVRLYNRARNAGVKPYLSYGFTSAIALYLAIYIVRPLWLGNWSEAPSHGIKALLDWGNNISVRYGNFYYNPFHMVCIFFLLGSTLLLSMHGATIWATAKYGAHEELEEVHKPGTGTERAQLFWRWVIGFNANAYSIHLWAFWFAWLMGITGVIGILITGTLVSDWFAWAQDAGVNFPQAAPPNVCVPDPITNLPPDIPACQQ